MMLRKNFIWVLVVASIAITAISLLFGVFFLFFFLPIMFPLALRRRSKAKKEEDYRSPPPPEQNPLRYDEDEDWREKWK